MKRALEVIAREPVVHFLILGAAIFSVWALVGPSETDETTAPHVIEVTPERVETLVDEFERTAGREATAAERDTLVDEWLREEVLVREARALGLDRRDRVVRRRLVQLMEIVLDDALALPTPDEATLRTWVEANPGLYQRPARVSFRHVFIEPSRHDDPAAKAGALLEALEGGASWRDLGDAWTRARSLDDRSRSRVQADFGTSFLEIFDVPAGTWTGPIESSFGLHLVKVTERSDAGSATFEEIRDRARRDWRAEQRRIARRDAVQALLERYEIRRTDR